jgi:GMP synthase (glutamine-hydrolysing)
MGQDKPVDPGWVLAAEMDRLPLPGMCNGDVELPGGLAPILVDKQGHWLAVRPDPLTCGPLSRRETKPGMLEDVIMEAKHNPPPHISELLADARMEWPRMQETVALVPKALVMGFSLMQERYKMPVCNLKVEPR